MTVEIDEAIRRDPRLLRDVEAATAVLAELPKEIPILSLPALVRWQSSSDAPDRLELGLYDSPSREGVGTRRRIPASLLATHQLRAHAVLRSVSDLLSARIEARPSIESLFGQLIENMEAVDAAQV